MLAKSRNTDSNQVVRGRPRLRLLFGGRRVSRLMLASKQHKRSGSVYGRRRMWPSRANCFRRMNLVRRGNFARRSTSAFETRLQYAALIFKMRLMQRVWMYSKWAKSLGFSARRCNPQMPLLMTRDSYLRSLSRVGNSDYQMALYWFMRESIERPRIRTMFCVVTLAPNSKPNVFSESTS